MSLNVVRMDKKQFKQFKKEGFIYLKTVTTNLDVCIIKYKVR
jgi:hypothetical protein